MAVEGGGVRQNRDARTRQDAFTFLAMMICLRHSDSEP